VLESFSPEKEQLTVVRLSAVSGNAVMRLLERGISPDGYPEILRRLRDLGLVFEPAQLIDKVFDPSKNPRHATPFPPTRFSAGDRAVFYSALEEETSIAEVRYHQTRAAEFQDLKQHASAPARYFWIFEIDFDGTILDLFPLRQAVTELTSRDESGYPKCRQLAEEARSRSISAFRTPSARRAEGTCTPVFERESLKDPKIKQAGRFTHENGDIVFRTS
jgi:hypothetical protein